ncbi:transglycosylase family protein [Brachybacterium huguangmaarense]
MPAHSTHRAEGAPVLFAGARLAPRAATVLGGVVAAGAIVGTGAASAQADLATWDRVAQCESSGNWSIVSRNGHYGGLQFSPSTWRAYGGLEYATTADKATKEQQIAIARRVLAGQGPGAWACAKRAGLTKATGDADPTAQPGGVSANPAPAPAAPANPAPAAQAPAPRAASGALAVDGRFGPATTRALQSWAGVRADGSLSRADVRAIQSKVGARPDGVIGRETTAKLQQAIGMSPNGAKSFRTDRATVRALQTHLNGA